MEREKLDEFIVGINRQHEDELAYQAKNLIYEIIKNQAKIKALETSNDEYRADLTKLEATQVDAKEVLG